MTTAALEAAVFFPPEIAADEVVKDGVVEDAVVEDAVLLAYVFFEVGMHAITMRARSPG